jgi:hypothetical protein
LITSNNLFTDSDGFAPLILDKMSTVIILLMSFILDSKKSLPNFGRLYIFLNNNLPFYKLELFKLRLLLIMIIAA